jgi:hypothetical protein
MGSGDLILGVAQYSRTRIQTNPTDNIYVKLRPLASEMKSRVHIELQLIVIKCNARRRQLRKSPILNSEN